MSYTCHSGGCPGADMEWERQGEKYGVKTIAYSFDTHIQEGKNRKILTADELTEGWFHVKIADKTLKKNVEGALWWSPYMRNLLCRNWFQVKNSEAIFAIAKRFLTKDTVDGGTGWAVQMAIDERKLVYVNDQIKENWLYFNYGFKMFLPMGGEIPKLTENFAGIGTRDINEYGRNAIRSVYKETFKV